MLHSTNTEQECTTQFCSNFIGTEVPLDRIIFKDIKFCRFHEIIILSTVHVSLTIGVNAVSLDLQTNTLRQLAMNNFVFRRVQIAWNSHHGMQIMA